MTTTASKTNLTGGRLVSTDGRALPLTGASLSADAKGGVVRVTLEQTFTNPHAEPLTVTYKLPLPAEGAVSGFGFRIGDKRVVGEVDTKQKARQRFEEAVLDGRTAALLDQERSALFTQEVGNVPPRTQVVCEVTIDQKLLWLPDGFWEWRFPTVVAPRYMGEEGRVADVAKVSIDVADTALPVKLSLGLSIRDRIADGLRPESPSHTVHTARGLDRFDVTFGDERGAGLDRDVVVRWRVADLSVGASMDAARPKAGRIADSAYGLLTLVPPAPEAHMAPVPRDLIVLLDTSGSMSGEPLDQARRVVSAMVDTLSDRDQLELIEFSYAPRRWRSGPVPATAANRKEAIAWLAKLRASGGTEMRSGILEALSPLRDDAQRQVVLVTDGLIGSEHEVLQAIANRLPKGSRVHTVGVGSAVNRSLTLPAARAGRGVELVCGLGEDVEAPVRRLLARTAQPLVTEVEVAGSAVEVCAPLRVPDLFGGAPAMLSLKLRPEGGEVVLRGKTAAGLFEQRLTVKGVGTGEGSPAVTALFARELVEDLELTLATGGSDKRETDSLVERLGLDYQISTRLTSWVAVSAEVTVDPRAPKRQETVPQNLPYGMSAEGLGLRPASAPMPLAASPARPSMRQRVSGGAPASETTKMRRDEGRAGPADDAKASIADMPAQFEADEEAEGVAERPTGEFYARRSMPGSPPQGAPPPAPKAPAPEQKKDESLVSRLTKKVFGEKAKEKAADKLEEAQVSRAAPAKPAPTPTRKLSARIVSTRDGRLAIELVVEDETGLSWAPASDAQLELASGVIVKVQVDSLRTTANGWYAGGLKLVLTLFATPEMGTPAKVYLASGGEVLELSL